jgi:Repeat of unknown function (DUF5648)
MSRTAQVTLLLLIALCFPSLVSAFPFPAPRSIDIYPWAPTPDQHAFLSVDDSISPSVPGPGGKPVSVQVTNIAGVITVNAVLAIDPNATTQETKFQVDLGIVPIGHYTLNYSSVEVGGTPVTNLSLSFTVSTQGYATAIEYFSPTLGHFFVTAFADEIAALDSGAISGWMRTGESFRVIPSTLAVSTLRPVCRFYGVPQAGLNSHFFTTSSSECSLVQKLYPGAWILETPSAFQTVPVDLTQSCPSGSVPVYRLYNNRPDANHRYTTSFTTAQQMIRLGWIPEVFPPTEPGGPATMCAPGP